MGHYTLGAYCQGFALFSHHVLVGVARSHIRLMLADNTLMLECTVLVMKILVAYKIDWARLIAEQTNEAALKRSTSIFFPCLIYRHYLELRVESLHQLDSLLEA